MIQLLRKISVYVSQKIIVCYPEQFSIQPYPVIAITTTDDGEDLVLLANDKRQFKWIALDECTLASIDDGEEVTRIYYFTFGSCGQLFEGGWVRIQADTLEDAQQKFIAYYGDKAWNNKGILNYAFDYPRDRFIFTRMFREGNFGKFEHDYIPGEEVTNIGKGARIRKQREEGTNRRNTLVTRERNPARMNNPANAEKLRKWLAAKTKAFQD